MERPLENNNNIDFTMDNTQYDIYKGQVQDKDTANNACTIFAVLECYKYVSDMETILDKNQMNNLYNLLQNKCEQYNCKQLNELSATITRLNEDKDINVSKPNTIKISRVPTTYNINYTVTDFIINDYNILGDPVNSDSKLKTFKSGEFFYYISNIWYTEMGKKQNEKPVYKRIAITFLSRTYAHAILFDLENEIIYSRDSHIKKQYSFKNDPIHMNAITSLYLHLLRKDLEKDLEKGLEKGLIKEAYIMGDAPYNQIDCVVFRSQEEFTNEIIDIDSLGGKLYSLYIENKIMDDYGRITNTSEQSKINTKFFIDRDIQDPEIQNKIKDKATKLLSGGKNDIKSGGYLKYRHRHIITNK